MRRIMKPVLVGITSSFSAADIFAAFFLSFYINVSFETPIKHFFKTSTLSQKMPENLHKQDFPAYILTSLTDFVTVHT